MHLQGDVFGPADLHLRWTNRQSTPSFPPQPPTPSQPSPLHSHPIAPPTTSTAPHAPELWTHLATSNPPPTATPSTHPLPHQGLPAGPTSSTRCICWPSSTRSTPTSTAPATCTSQHPPQDTLTPTAKKIHTYKTSSIQKTTDQGIHITLRRSTPMPIWLADGPIPIQDPEDAGQHYEVFSTTSASCTSSSTCTTT